MFKSQLFEEKLVSVLLFTELSNWIECKEYIAQRKTYSLLTKQHAVIKKQYILNNYHATVQTYSVILWGSMYGSEKTDPIHVKSNSSSSKQTLGLWYGLALDLMDISYEV